MHSTDDLEDGYLGSGKRLWYSIKKYGKENHVREIVEFFSDRESLKKQEIQIITEDLIDDKLCMNLRKGGSGFDSEEASRISAMGWKNGKTREANRQVWIIQKEKMFKNLEKGRTSEAQRKKLLNNQNWLGKKHEPETIEKMRQSAVGKHMGDKNGSFGSKWIFNERLRQSKRIMKEEIEVYLSQGWKIGRKQYNGE